MAQRWALDVSGGQVRTLPEMAVSKSKSTDMGRDEADSISTLKGVKLPSEN